MPTNIVKYGSAEFDNLLGWNYSNAAVGYDSTKKVRYYRLRTDGYIEQSIGASFLAEISVSYVFKFDFYREIYKDPLQLDTDGYATIYFAYDNEEEDTYTLPLSKTSGIWQTSEIEYQTRTDAGLKGISIIFAVSTITEGIRLTKIELRASDEKLLRGTDNNTGGSFEDKSILYGPEAALPLLGGD